MKKRQSPERSQLKSDPVPASLQVTLLAPTVKQIKPRKLVPAANPSRPEMHVATMIPSCSRMPNASTQWCETNDMIMRTTLLGYKMLESSEDCEESLGA